MDSTKAGTGAGFPTDGALERARRTRTYLEISAQAETLGWTWRSLRDREPVRNRQWPVFVGCGSSYYLATYAARLATRSLRCPALALPASILWLAPETLEPWVERLGTPLIVGISRSGETSEVIHALEIARRRGFRTVAVTCNPAGSIREVASELVGLPHVREESVVMTHSFSNMALALAWLAATWSPGAGIAEELGDLAAEAERWVAEGELKAAAWAAQRPRHFVFLGAGPLFPIAQEAALKVKETSQLPAEAYPPLEVRHGPQAVVSDGSLVVLLDGALPEEEAVLADQQRLGARTERLPSPAGRIAPWWAAHAALPALQFLALFRAVLEGRDPDRPSHLTQAVRLGEDGEALELRQAGSDARDSEEGPGHAAR